MTCQGGWKIGPLHVWVRVSNVVAIIVAQKLGMSQPNEKQSATLLGDAEVGRLVDSSQADDRRLIGLVRARRLLYSRNNMPVASFYVQVKALWEEVANEMGWSVADARRKWSHIRNSYSRHLRNEVAGARTGRGRMVSRWYLADELDFLRDHMATDTRAASYSSFSPSMLELDMSEQRSESREAQSFGGAWFALGAGDGPALAKSEPQTEGECTAGEDSSSSQAFRADENSSYFQFFRGLYEEYCDLPSRRRRLFKRQCLHFLHELLDEQERERALPVGDEPAILPND